MNDILPNYDCTYNNCFSGKVFGIIIIQAYKQTLNIEY